MLELSWGERRQCLLRLETCTTGIATLTVSIQRKEPGKSTGRLKKQTAVVFCNEGRHGATEQTAVLLNVSVGQKGRTELPVSGETGKMWKMPSSGLTVSALRHRQAVTCLITEKLLIYLFPSGIHHLDLRTVAWSHRQKKKKSYLNPVQSCKAVKDLVFIVFCPVCDPEMLLMLPAALM